MSRDLPRTEATKLGDGDVFLRDRIQESCCPQARTQRWCITNPPPLCAGVRAGRDPHSPGDRCEQGLGPPLQVTLYLPLGSFCGRLRLEGLISSLEYSPPGCSLCSVDFYSSVNLLHKASLFPPQGRLFNPFSNLLKISPNFNGISDISYLPC